MERRTKGMWKMTAIILIQEDGDGTAIYQEAGLSRWKRQWVQEWMCEV